MPFVSRRSEGDRVPSDLLGHVLPAPVFSSEATRLWQRIWAKHLAFLASCRDRVDASYLAGLAQLDLDPFGVPTVEDINRRLAAIGWSAVPVDGYIPTPVYTKLLLQRIFPVAAFLRSAAHVDHSPAPDFAHDVLGHLPLLFCPQHRAYLRRLAALMSTTSESAAGRALHLANRRMSTLVARSAPGDEIARAQILVDRARAEDNACPSEQSELGRIFLWSIEFGLVGNARSYQLFGAGLLSSPRESRLACAPTAPVRPYSLDVIRHDIEFSSPQKRYFVADGYGVFHDVLDRYESLLASRREREGADVAAYARA